MGVVIDFRTRKRWQAPKRLQVAARVRRLIEAESPRRGEFRRIGEIAADITARLAR